jgi:hypothetical protein
MRYNPLQWNWHKSRPWPYKQRFRCGRYFTQKVTRFISLIMIFYWQININGALLVYRFVQRFRNERVFGVAAISVLEWRQFKFWQKKWKLSGTLVLSITDRKSWFTTPLCWEMWKNWLKREGRVYSFRSSRGKTSSR